MSSCAAEEDLLDLTGPGQTLDLGRDERTFAPIPGMAGCGREGEAGLGAQVEFAVVLIEGVVVPAILVVAAGQAAVLADAVKGGRGASGWGGILHAVKAGKGIAKQLANEFGDGHIDLGGREADVAMDFLVNENGDVRHR